MPKIKTRRSAAKRFEMTGSGKYRRHRQNLFKLRMMPSFDPEIPTAAAE